MFAVAKINSIRTALSFVKNNASRGPHLSKYTSRAPKVTNNNPSSNNRLAVCNVSSRDEPVECVKSCDRKWTNQKQEICINRQLHNKNENLVGAITHSERSYPKTLNSNKHIEVKRRVIKLEILLKKHPSLNSGNDETEVLPTHSNLEAITKETRSIKSYTTISLPSAF